MGDGGGEPNKLRERKPTYFLLVPCVVAEVSGEVVLSYPFVP